MGLREAFKSAAVAAISGFGNTATFATFIVNGSRNYNPTTGVASATDDSYQITMIFANYSVTEMDDQVIKLTDIKGLVAGKALDDLSITPTVGDQIQKNNVTREIVNFTKDPAEALYTFQLRIP